MIVVDPGRRYELAAGNSLVFVQKERGDIICDGTTNEELLEVLIDRVTEAYRSLPCEESIRALHLLRMALETFRMRTERRMAANVEGTYQPHSFIFEADEVSRGAAATNDFDLADFGPN